MTNEAENRFANAEAYASHYCDARDFHKEQGEDDIWRAVRSGFIEGDMHATATAQAEINRLTEELVKVKKHRDEYQCKLIEALEK